MTTCFFPGIDIGSASVRAGVFDANGQRLALCGGATHNPLWMREYADATGYDIHLLQEEDAVTFGSAITGAVACQAFPDLAAATQQMVRPGSIVAANPARKAFHDRKYQVYLQMWEHQQALNRLMHKDNA